MTTVHLARIVGLLLATIALAVIGANSQAQSQSAKGPIDAKIVPDAEIQKELTRATKALAEQPDGALNALMDLAIKRPEVLAAQVIYFDASAKTEREAWRAMGLMKYLATRWDSEMRQGLVPLLEIADDKTRGVALAWLQTIDGNERFDSEAFVRRYKTLLAGAKKAPPPGLVSYLYSVNPGQAAMLFEELELGQGGVMDRWPHTMLWSDHVVSTVQWRLKNYLAKNGDVEKAQNELTMLANHDGWYARRYVVEIIRATPKLGTKTISDLLRKDGHRLVVGPAQPSRFP